MAAFNFPNSPSTNDVYTANGVSFKWNGTIWQRISASTGAQGGTGSTGPTGAQGAAAGLTISTSAPGSPSAGDMWWDSDSGLFLTYYNDGNSSQWVELNQGPKGAQGATGPTGAQGATGPTGAQGAAGAQGATGAAGSNASISSNADNRLITGGSGTNLVGEANLTFDGTTFEAESGSGVQVIRSKSGGSSGDYAIVEVRNSSTSRGRLVGDAAVDAFRIDTAGGASTPITFLTGSSYTERLRIDTNGKLTLSNSEGIQLSAKTSSLYTSDGSISYYATNNAVYINGAGASGWMRLSAAGTANNRTAINIYGHSYATPDRIDFRTNSLERFRITSSGTAVFGGNGAAPIVDNGELYYRGNSTQTFENLPQNLYLYSDDIAYNGTNPGAGMVFGGQYTSGGAYTTFAGIHAIKENSTDNQYGGALIFGVRPDGAATPWEKLRIKSDGDIVATGNLKTNNLPGRNKIINGATQIWQRGGGSNNYSGSHDGYYAGIADRWAIRAHSSMGTQTYDKNNNVPNGFGYSQRIYTTSADGGNAGKYYVFDTKLEGQDLQGFEKGTSTAKPFTLSFYVKCNINRVFTCELRDLDNNRMCVQQYTTTNFSKNTD